MSTHTTHYPLDPADIKARAWQQHDEPLYVTVDFDADLSITLVDRAGRMHPQVFTARLRELADEIDRKCDAIRDEQAHVGQLVDAKAVPA